MNTMNFSMYHSPLVKSYFRRFFKNMKKDAMFIDCARGGVCDEAALHEALKNEEIAGDDWYPQYSEGAYNDTLTMTNTAKLFFPDSKLEKGTYYVTLDFYVEVSVSIAQSYSWVGAWSGAALGPHIVEAEIITDGDFGNCGWLDPAAGAGFFDGGGKG